MTSYAAVCRRKAVEAQVTSVETALQQKITEQRASALAAEKKGVGPRSTPGGAAGRLARVAGGRVRQRAGLGLP